MHDDRAHDGLRDANLKDIELLAASLVAQEANLVGRAGIDMLVDLVVEEIPLGVGLVTREADKLVGFVLHADVERAAFGVGKACDCLEPTRHVLAVEACLALELGVLKRGRCDEVFKQHTGSLVAA